MRPEIASPPKPSAPLEAHGIETFAGDPSFSFRHRLLRLAWGVVWALLAAWTPPPMHRWRIFLINLFGGKVHPTCSVYGSVKIWYPPNLTMERMAGMGPGVECYSMGAIEIGAFAVISQRTFLCTGTHDVHHPNFQIGARPILIGANVWIAAEAFIGPGVTVGEGAVLGARGAVFRDMQSWTIYQGNPAVPIKARAEFKRSG